jgi:hypothetical protein
MTAEEVNRRVEQKWDSFLSGEITEQCKYSFYEITGCSMNDGSARALCVGDVLKCLEIEQWDKMTDLNNLNYVVVVAIAEGLYVGEISSHEAGVITLHLRNPAFRDLRIQCSDIKTIYAVESRQRDMTPEAEERRSRNN